MGRRTPAFLLATAVVAAIALLAVLPRVAEAHALAVSSVPAPNSKLAESPKTIDITFSEAIEPSVSTIQLWDQAGKQVELPKPTFYSDDPKRMSVDVPVTLPEGIYTVIWRNLSKVDGHTWPGSFPFTVLGPNGEEPAGVAATISDIGGGKSDTPSTLDTTARWSVLAAVSVLVGGILFSLGVMRPCLRFISPGDERRTWATSRTVLLVSSVTACLLVIEGTLVQVALKAQDFGGLHSADTILLHTRFGKYLLARLGLTLLALALLAVAARARDTRASVAALWGVFVASIGLVLTHALVGHAASGDGAVTGVAIDFLHLLAVSIWLGSLFHMVFTFPRWLELLRAGSRTVFVAYVFRRFSGMATLAVGLLLASGVLSAALQAPSWSALWDSNWGRALDAKLGLTLMLLAIGGVNAYLLRPRVVEAVLEEHSPPVVVRKPGLGSDAGVRSLQRRLLTMIRVEATMGAIVLASAAALIQLQSPRDSAAAAAYAASGQAQGSGGAIAGGAVTGSGKTAGFTQTREVGILQLFLDVTPAKVGENEFTLGLGSEFGNPPEVLQARLQFDREGDTSTEGQSRIVLTNAAGTPNQVLYKGTSANLSLPGRWKITVNLRIKDKDDVSQEFELDVAGAQGATKPASTSIWDWPLDNAFSVAAMVVIAAVAVAGAGWQFWGRRALHAK
jgi:copper transport protein